MGEKNEYALLKRSKGPSIGMGAAYSDTYTIC
jgi:hypothetical protein